MTPLEELAQELQTLVKTSVHPLYSVDEAAAMLDCTRKSIEDRLRAGVLPGVKFGRSWVLPAQAFIRHINEQATSEAAAKRAKRQQEISAAVEMASHLQPRTGRRRKTPPSLDGPYIVFGELKNLKR